MQAIVCFRNAKGNANILLACYCEETTVNCLTVKRKAACSFPESSDTQK